MYAHAFYYILFHPHIHILSAIVYTDIYRSRANECVCARMSACVDLCVCVCTFQPSTCAVDATYLAGVRHEGVLDMHTRNEVLCKKLFACSLSPVSATITITTMMFSLDIVYVVFATIHIVIVSLIAL